MKALVLTLSVLLPFAAAARDLAPDPVAEDRLAPPPKEVSITLVGSDEKSFTIRINNGTGKPFGYIGYSPGFPLYQIKEHPIGWCGTGTSKHLLDPGNSVTFKINREMIRDPKTEKIRVEVGGVTSPPIPVR